MVDAINGLLGSGGVRNLDAPSDPARITLSGAGVTWSVMLDRVREPFETVTIDGREAIQSMNRAFPGTLVQGTTVTVVDDTGAIQTVTRKPQTHLMIEALQAQAPDNRVTQRLDPILGVLRGSRYFARPLLDALRVEGSQQSGDVALDSNAMNLFTVLRNWRDLSEHEHRYQFIAEQMTEIFPTEFRRFDFDAVAQRVSAAVVTPRWKEKQQPTDWADGFFTCLVHLVSLASCDPGAIVAIDEPENSLHPALIKKLLEAMRDWAAQQSITVVCATHSPALLDQFADEPDQVYVMERGRDLLPVRLDELKKKDWLRHYALGDLYSHSEVGAPT
jgi:predicted ATPase